MLEARAGGKSWISDEQPLVYFAVCRLLCESVGSVSQTPLRTQAPYLSTLVRLQSRLKSCVRLTKIPPPLPRRDCAACLPGQFPFDRCADSRRRWIVPSLARCELTQPVSPAAIFSPSCAVASCIPSSRSTRHPVRTAVYCLLGAASFTSIAHDFLLHSIQRHRQTMSWAGMWRWAVAIRRVRHCMP